MGPNQYSVFNVNQRRDTVEVEILGGLACLFLSLFENDLPYVKSVGATPKFLLLRFFLGVSMIK